MASSKNFLTIQQKVVDLSAEKVSQSEQIAFNILKQAARTFINNTLLIDNHMKQIKKTINLQEQITATYSLMRDDENELRRLLQEQHSFQIALDQYLGRETFLSIVLPDGTPIFYDSQNIGKELYTRATKQQGRGTIDMSAKKTAEEIDMFNFARNMDSILQEKIKKSVANRRLVYTTALERYQKNKDPNHMRYDNSLNTLWWRTRVRRDYIDWSWPTHINHAGWIAEGYMEAVINEDPDIVDDNLEFALKYLYSRYIIADSIPAAIKADIQVRGTDVEIAVKEGKFSTARIGQFFMLALSILAIEKYISKQSFKEILPFLINKSSSKNQSFTKATQDIINAANEYGKKQLVLTKQLRTVATKTLEAGTIRTTVKLINIK